jgi:hypothetical protein
MDKLYDITFQERDGYLYASVSGDVDNFEVSYGYWQEVAEKCKSLGAKKVLIVEDLPGASSMAEVYQLASALPQMGFYNIKIAFVDRHIDQNELNQFGELVAVNRGLHGKIFNDLSEAEKWIEAN